MLLAHALASGHFEIVAVCDVNSLALARAARVVVDAGGQKPQLFSDYEEMYAMPGLQAVAIATPTHWHALQFIAACKKGLHVFLEKPISYDIREGQAMLAAHQKAGNVVQVDFPRMLAGTNEAVKAYIDSGEMGKIYQVQATINSQDARLIEKAIPSTMDFETFCGPAPRCKYLCNENSDTPNWRGQHAFSRGIMMDWGIHHIHNARQVLGLGLPDRVSAMGGITRNFTQDNPDYLAVQFDFGGLPLIWSHKTWGFTSPIPDHNIGVTYYGEKGTLFAGDMGWEVYSAGGGDKIAHGEVTFAPNKPGNLERQTKMMTDMFTEFAVGIRTNSNKGITNPLSEAQKTTFCVIFGDLAYRTQAGLDIDPETQATRGNDWAQALLKRTYRSPYEHPYTS
jgi:predicted dehydrogenase